MKVNEYISLILICVAMAFQGVHEFFETIDYLFNPFIFYKEYTIDIQWYVHDICIYLYWIVTSYAIVLLTTNSYAKLLILFVFYGSIAQLIMYLLTFSSYSLERSILMIVLILLLTYKLKKE